jgi:aldehyde dehydrogenase (NAD+)
MKIGNWINGREIGLDGDDWLDKFDPATGKLQCRVVSATREDVEAACRLAAARFPDWSAETPIARGKLLRRLVNLMQENAGELAACVATETGKPDADAAGEVDGAIMQGEYFAGEGMRLYANSLTSGMPGKHAHSVRQPIGVAGLSVPANTPIANIAWKAFPALICGNSVVLKAAEDSPRLAILFAGLSKEAGIPDGVFNVIQGPGETAGRQLVSNRPVDIISFTGSTKVGIEIAEVAARRLAKVSLELGGNNAFVVCDDANIDQAVHWAALSAFSNAGQRCAAASRLLVFDSVYDEFRDRLVERAEQIVLGVGSIGQVGPVINESQLQGVLASITHAVANGAKLLTGGKRASGRDLDGGYYVEPTILEGVSPGSRTWSEEVFGPVTSLTRVDSLPQALDLANYSDYGLTAAIHTTSTDRAMWFAERVRAGTVNVNIATYGSEPHMPFGGFGLSGNGSREPGVEAIGLYTELKNIAFLTRPDLI